MVADAGCLPFVGAAAADGVDVLSGRRWRRRRRRQRLAATAAAKAGGGEGRENFEGNLLNSGRNRRLLSRIPARSGCQVTREDGGGTGKHTFQSSFSLHTLLPSLTQSPFPARFVRVDALACSLCACGCPRVARRGRDISSHFFKMHAGHSQSPSGICSNCGVRQLMWKHFLHAHEIMLHSSTLRSQTPHI